MYWSSGMGKDGQPYAQDAPEYVPWCMLEYTQARPAPLSARAEGVGTRGPFYAGKASSRSSNKCSAYVTFSSCCFAACATAATYMGFALWNAPPGTSWSRQLRGVLHSQHAGVENVYGVDIGMLGTLSIVVFLALYVLFEVLPLATSPKGKSDTWLVPSLASACIGNLLAIMTISCWAGFVDITSLVLLGSLYLCQEIGTSVYSWYSARLVCDEKDHTTYVSYAGTAHTARGAGAECNMIRVTNIHQIFKGELSRHDNLFLAHCLRCMCKIVTWGVLATHAAVYILESSPEPIFLCGFGLLLLVDMVQCVYSPCETVTLHRSQCYWKWTFQVVFAATLVAQYYTGYAHA